MHQNAQDVSQVEQFLQQIPSLPKILQDTSNLTTQQLAIIILLFKKGNTKLLGNYCPISLTNSDYKILAYILTSRIENHLTEIISVNQTAYMKGRFIGCNIHSIQDAITHFDKHKLSHLVLFLDFKKAFDSISHEFLFQLLEYIGMPIEFIKWIHIIYGDAVSMVRQYGWLTNYFQIQRGVRLVSNIL